MSLPAATAFALLLGVLPAEDPAAQHIVLSFDDAWNRRDVAALMAPISSRFGCDMYGEINVSHVDATLRSLLERLAGSECHTELVELSGREPVIRAFARRRIQAGGRCVEELDHVLYLRHEADGLKITGLEDFDPAGVARVSPPVDGAPGAYRNDRLAFRFETPPSTFVVPAPPLGAALDHVFVRSDDLGDEIELFVIQTSEPFEVERALDLDLEAWSTQVDHGSVESRESTTIRGAPASRATARYLGASCALVGGEPKKNLRRMARTYAKLDSRLLLAIDLRTSAERFESARATLESLLASFAFDAPPGPEYGRLVASRTDAGIIAGGRFRDAKTGFALRVPDGFDLERIATNGLFHLVVSEPARGGAIEVHAEAEVLMDPATPLSDFANAQDLALEACVGQRGGQLAVTPRADRTVGGVQALLSERRVKSRDGTRVERCAYLVHDGVAFTLRVQSSVGRASDAAAAFARVLDAIRFDGS